MTPDVTEALTTISLFSLAAPAAVIAAAREMAAAVAAAAATRKLWVYGCKGIL